jgi:hypothetical protein
MWRDALKSRKTHVLLASRAPISLAAVAQRRGAGKIAAFPAAANASTYW